MKNLLLSFALLLCAVAAHAQPIRQQGFTTNSAGQVVNAQGSRVIDLFGLSVTNGQLALTTNANIGFGGATNDNQGVASTLNGAINSSNVFNVVRGQVQLLLATGTASADGKVTNAVTSTLGPNLLVASQTNSKIETNTIAIEDNAAANIAAILLDHTGLGGAQDNWFRLGGSSSGNIFSGNILPRGRSTLQSSQGGIGALRMTAGSNSLDIVGSVHALDTDGGFTVGSAVGSVVAMYTGAGGWNSNTSIAAIRAMSATGSTNNASGGGISSMHSTTGGRLTDFKTSGGLFVGTALDNQSVTASGIAPTIVSYASTVSGSSAVSGDGAVLIGGGRTNAFPYTLDFGYDLSGAGRSALFVGTNANVGIGTNDLAAGYALDVLGSQRITVPNLASIVPTNSGLLLANMTLATAGVPQNSPGLTFRSHGWDTDSGGFDVTNVWTVAAIPTSAASPANTFTWYHSVNGAAPTTPLRLFADGGLSPSYLDTATILMSPNIRITAPGSGRIAFRNSGGTAGAQVEALSYTGTNGFQSTSTTASNLFTGYLGHNTNSASATVHLVGNERTNILALSATAGGPNVMQVNTNADVDMTGNLNVGQFVNAAHGTLTMSTGVVNVATSASTNIVQGVWNYTFVDAPVGVETNTSLVLSNAGHVFISFGGAIASNASGAGTTSIHIATNHVICTVLHISGDAVGANTYETGFKEFAISLPALCRITMYVGQTTAQTVNLKNLCMNIKGAN